jgi:hypothetical protein
VFPLSGAIATKVLSYGAGHDNRRKTYQSSHIGVGTSHVCTAIHKGYVGEPSMYKHGLENTVTERLNMSHMLTVIEKTQSTFAAIPLAMTIGGGVVN